MNQDNFKLGVALGAMLAAAAYVYSRSQTEEQQPKTLYEKLGGEPALEVRGESCALINSRTWAGRSGHLLWCVAVALCFAPDLTCNQMQARC
jgi:hypothetical protein